MRGKSYHQSSNDDRRFLRSASLLSRSTTKIYHTPSPSLRSSSRSGSIINSLKRSLSRRSASSSSPTDISNVNLSKIMNQCNESTPKANSNLSRSTSRRSTTPIIFSQTTARKNPQPIEKKLECSLEELYFGAIKKIMITRDVISDEG